MALIARRLREALHQLTSARQALRMWKSSGVPRQPAEYGTDRVNAVEEKMLTPRRLVRSRPSADMAGLHDEIATPPKLGRG